MATALRIALEQEDLDCQHCDLPANRGYELHLQNDEAGRQPRFVICFADYRQCPSCISQWSPR